MEWKEVDICQLCDSVSETYKGNASEVVLINTSDVLDGKCLNHEYVPNKKLKGQFKKTFRKGDILYSEIRPANKRFCFVDFEPKDYIASTKLMVLRAHEDVDPKYLYQILRSNDTLAQLQMLAESRSGTFPQITYSELSNIMVSLPSQKAQKNIVSILSSLDRKIELNNKINADLEEMAQAIFKNWFVDFEPFKDGKFVDSELGMIPEGWKVGSLGDFCNVFTGRKNTNQAIEKGLYPFFSCAPEPLASNEAIFNGKAIIIAGNGSYTGRTSFYNGGFDLYQRTYACTIRERDKENLMIFFYHMMKQFFEPVKMGGTRGSSIPYIVMGDITQQKFPYSEDWLLRFSNIANSMMDKKLRIDKENSRLSLLRDTLLPRLMSGEIEIPE